MTENEAKKGLLFLKEKLYNGIFKDKLGCIDKAIQDLEEIQQYRAIDTIEKFEAWKEKNKAKKVVDNGEELLCPSCGYDLMGSINEPDHDPYYCFECGQALDWERKEKI